MRRPLVIEFETAGFSYGTTPILEETTLALAPGSFHFLIGVCLQMRGCTGARG